MNDKRVLIRLIEEWMTHKKIIIAYDFDNTVFDYHQKGDSYDMVIQLLKDCEEVGAYFLVNTCCDSSKLPDIVAYLKKHAIPFDKINENMDFIPFQERKLYYNILLDDRAGLSSAYHVLKQAMEIMREHPQSVEDILLDIKG